MGDGRTGRDIGYCGYFCVDCARMKAGSCVGCKSGGGLATCQVRSCAEGRGFTTCAECTEMEPCRKLNNVFSPGYAIGFFPERESNLREIRRLGLQKFLG